MRSHPRCAAGTLVLLGSFFVPSISSAQTAAPATAPLRATRLTTPPVIDGALDDEAWTGAPLPTGKWLSYNPLHGESVPQETTVWVGYDRDALYFAFRCDDPDPSGIKTSITRRDNIWSDDWVGFSLDALGNGQVSYHLLVNPSGIQLDMINTPSGFEDTSPDWVWQSAGRTTPTGYAVEIRLPLQTVRFKGGADVQMGILFWRRVSRTGVSVAWPALEPGKWVFQKHARLGFSDITARPTRELIPSATFSRGQERATPDAWDAADNQGDLGLSGKWGLSSTVTLDATINPDFSQVESDAFQVEVNQRFPIFFSEKRPFFMEGAGIFNLAGNAQGDASMLYAVHTRKIVDPIFGAKLTGSLGRVAFGTLTAIDQGPGRTTDPDDPLNGKDKLFQIARAQLTLNPGSYAGVMTTITELAGRTNVTGGADLNYSKGNTSLTAFVLGSDTSGGEDNGRGVGMQATYGFRSRRIGVQSQVEHYGRGFVMDTAFMNRVGITSGWGYFDYSFYPDKDRHPWIRKISPFVFYQRGTDRIQGGDDYVAVSGVRLNLTRQGFVRADRVELQEAWRGGEYDGDQWRVSAEMQVFRWLRPSFSLGTGHSLYYEESDPFVGASRSARLGAVIQIGGRFSEDISYTHNTFDRPDSGGRVYTVDVVNTRTTYQFTKELAIRSIVRFDSQQRRVLTDFLGSYDLRPGTVVYVGYGTLFQKRAFRNDAWVEGEGDYLTTRQGLFFKASYLYRF
jgi:hypothetical protein